MSKIDDIELFVQVVQSGGLAAAGRKVGLSPASMTARINALERRYQTRILNRSTRSIALTDAGRRFYEVCLRIVAEMAEAEATLQDGEQQLEGVLRITATSDFGRQVVAPALLEFSQIHPGVKPHLHLTDSVINILEERFDLAVRFGNLPDSNLIMRSLRKDNRRVLCASTDYIEQRGLPTQPEDLLNHLCLVMERFGEPLNEWYFHSEAGQKIIKVSAALSTNDGALVRQWALAGAGIALKSIWDIKPDIDSGKLITVLDDYTIGFSNRDDETVGLQLIYPSRQYLPKRTEKFIEFFSDFVEKRS